MADPYYNPVPLTPNSIARAEDVNRELAKIRAAFAKLPLPTNIPSDASGTPRYIHIAFADSADGTANFTTGTQGNRAYLGIAANQISETPSTFAEDYVWMRIRGADGTDGAPGEDGTPGAPGASGNYTETRYIRSLAPPTQAIGSNPAGTSLSAPSGTDPLWQTTARRDGSGNLITPWAPWERISAYPPPAAYDPAFTYYQGMQVLFGGGTYILIAASSVGNAPTGTGQANAYWDVVAAPGGAGTPSTPPSAVSTTIDLTSTTTGANLRALADAAGYTGHSDATITFRVPNGVTVTGAPDGGKAIDTGTWPTGSYAIALTVHIENGGIVQGGGGQGGGGGSGQAGYPGGAGGDAIFQRVALAGVIVDTGGILRGGGGGGAGGYATEGYQAGELYGGAGGGGGGGRPNGNGGFGGFTLSGFNSASPGTAGTASANGTGGNGMNDGPAQGGPGGAGGNFGANGSNVTGAMGGAAGHAIRRNGFTSPVTNNGSITGTVG